MTLVVNHRESLLTGTTEGPLSVGADGALSAWDIFQVALVNIETFKACSSKSRVAIAVKPSCKVVARDAGIFLLAFIDIYRGR